MIKATKITDYSGRTSEGVSITFKVSCETIERMRNKGSFEDYMTDILYRAIMCGADALEP